MTWQPRMQVSVTRTQLKNTKEHCAVTDTFQQPRAPPAQAPSYVPEPPSNFVHDVESHHTHDELAVAQSMVELARPLRDIQALPAPGPPPHSPHAITGDQSTISALGLLSTPAQPIIMGPNNPGAMLPQDQITFMDRLFPHATWIQNPGGYSKVVELMRHAKYRTLTQIGGGPFTKSNELAAVVRNKFVNDYRRSHGEAVFKEKDGKRHQAQNRWFDSLSLDGKTDYIHYAMRQLVGLLTDDEQRKIQNLKQGVMMAVGSGSGNGVTNIGLHTEIGTSRGNTNNRVTGGMGFMSTAAPSGPVHGGAANGMSLARNPTSSAADIVRVRGSTTVSLRPLLPKARDTGSGIGNNGVQNRGSGDGLSDGNTVQQAVQTFSEGPTAAQRLAVRNTRNPTNLPNPQRTPAIAQVPAAAPNVNSPTNDPVRSSVQAIMQELQTYRESRKQLDRKIEALENNLTRLLQNGNP